MKNYNLYLMLMILFGMSNAHASITLELRSGSSNEVGRFYFGMLHNWSGPDAYPNPCYKASRCEIGMGIRWLKEDGSSISPKQQLTRWMTPANAKWTVAPTTMGELGDKFRENIGVPQRVDFDYMSSAGLMLPFVCLTYRINGGTTQYTGYCADYGQSPPEPTQCDALTKDMRLDYRELTADRVEGALQKGLFTLSCNRDATVRIYAKGLTSGGILNLNAAKTLRSKLLIGNVAADKGITATVKEKMPASYEVSSTLMSSGDITEGSFFGSTVVVVEIQ